MSPQHTPYEDQKVPYANNIPVAVLAAVHRADTGTTNTKRTHTIAVRTPSSHKSEGSLDHPSSAYTNIINTHPAQAQFYSDLGLRPNETVDTQTSPEYAYKLVTSLPKRHVWQRSASCRELYDFSFEDSGKAKHKPKPPKPIEKTSVSVEERKLESPITRYDDHRALYAASSQDGSLEIHQDIMMPNQKVYSSSYPGTTSYSQESVEDPGNYDLRDSQDDLSHDSYELIERSDDDYSISADYKYRKNKPLNTRSCSLDSGNYLPSDTDSEPERKHKCKSSSDVHYGVFTLDDPRDLPREIIPRKSDGSFYKAFKTSSRTSSLESKSDYYESKTSKPGKSRKSGRERSLVTRTSSQESRSDYENKRSIRENRSFDSLYKQSDYVNSRTCSVESKSEYSDALSKAPDVPPRYTKYQHEYDRKIQFERNYGTQKQKRAELDKVDNSGISSFKETSHVHSISLQNVETEYNTRTNRSLGNFDQNTIPRAAHRATRHSYNDDERNIQTTHIWPEKIAGIPTEIKKDWSAKQRSTESESNIFSFDEDKIQSLQESDVDVGLSSDQSFGVVPNIDNETVRVQNGTRNPFRDVFVEIEPRRLEKGREPMQLHQPIERTKSDPNSLARQRLNSTSRRLLLMHQKSIDLTPAESSDEDYLYKQIPSAPPITKYRGTHFEMPTAEFGHFDILKREIEGQKTKFEVPKRQFEVLGAKTQFDLINLPPKSETDIPYVLHKRHIINGVTSKEQAPTKENETLVHSPDEAKHKPSFEAKRTDELQTRQKSKPKSPVESGNGAFLFTQNIDLSKIDPVTLEVDKSAVQVQHISSPKRDITRIDPVLLETLNSKLSQIESDSPTSSKTESLKPHQRNVIQRKVDEQTITELQGKIVPPPPQQFETEKKILSEKSEQRVNVKDKIKIEVKSKRVIKPRMQPGKKGGKANKTKVRITSFSSDDESLDSDDVFGSAEATPTKLEFSPPQMRKEMESILKFESERKYLQYTMSSTEVEGSPPQTRKKTEPVYDRSLDATQTELRRISERSFSLPSSEDDLNMKVSDMQPVFAEPPAELDIESNECDKDEADKSIDETSRDQITVEEVLKENKEKDLDEEMEREKMLLKSEIEEDLKNLRVPSRTKITEITSPSVSRKSQSPLLHARLNLSEGSAFTLLQKQQATESPVPGRRAKSLDAPIIPVTRLPPLNAFSSKDDTVEEEDQTAEEKMSSVEIQSVDEEIAITSQKTLDSKHTPTSVEKVDQLNTTVKPAISAKPDLTRGAKEGLSRQQKADKETNKKLKEKQKITEKDQIVPDVTSKVKKSSRPSVQTKPLAQKSVTARTKAAVSQHPSLKDKPSPKEKLPQKPPLSQKPSLPKSSPQSKVPAVPIKSEKIPAQKAASCEKEENVQKGLPLQKSLPTQLSLTLPEIKRTKSQEMEPNKKTAPKEKAKSLEKLEFKRMGSKERTKSQDESETVIAKRKEKQQMLYETAVKQTLKSPVKDTLPVFPQVEEMVRERHGKLEISINTIENTTVPLEEAIIITKSPKKLDKKMDKKLTKSLELNLVDGQDEQDVGKSVQRLGKSLDLDNRPKEQEQLEFSFQTEHVERLKAADEAKDVEETSPESDEQVVQRLVEAQVHTQPADTEDVDAKAGQDLEHRVILEGTSLDVWLSLEDKSKQPRSKLENIKVIQQSNDFFEQPGPSKPPDLGKVDTKSSSDSQSLERVSLGNSLDIKYIDDSGDSSHRSEKDTQLIAEMQKASETVGRLLRKKLEKRKKIESLLSSEKPSLDEVDKNIVRITSEDESLTEVSELKCETDTNFLAVESHKDVLLKLSIERSRSEDTGSWITLECDECVGAEESFEMDNVPLESPEKVSPGEGTEVEKSLLIQSQLEVKTGECKNVAEEVFEAIEDSNLLTTDVKYKKIDFLKRSSDQSRSSDTTGSWTSGEKDISPSNVKETATGDESSVSCSLGHAFGISQTIEKFATREQIDKSSPDIETPRSPRSPRSPRICVLGRTFTIDEDSSMPNRMDLKYRSEDSSSEEANDIPKDLTPIQETDKESSSKELDNVKYKKSRYPFEEKWSNESELSQKLQQKIVKKLSSADKNSLSSVDDSYSERKKDGKGSLHSFEKLSTESRNSVDTESSSGSLGVATRLQKSGDIPKELSSTWRPFPLDSSGSSSFEEGLLPPDRDGDQQEYFLCRDNSGDFAGLSDIRYKTEDNDATPTKDSTQIPDDLANFPTNFGYPSITSNIGGIGLNIASSDMLTGYCTTYLSRTLSRISERSTNSEKSSLEEDSTKVSTQSDSLNDESLASSDRQVSLSSDTPSHAHVSESERKTGDNGKNIPCKRDHTRSSDKKSSEPIPNINNLLQRQISDDRRTSAEMAELSMDDIEIITSERGLQLKRQDSDDTVIDEECFEADNKQEKQGSSSQSEEWPLPDIPSKDDKTALMALHEAASTDTSQQTTQVFQPPCSNIPKTFGLRGSLKSQDSEQWPSPPSSVKEPPVVGDVETFYITPPEEACKVMVDSSTVSTYDNDSNSDNENKTDVEGEKTHTYENVATGEHISESISESLSAGPSGVKIVLDDKSEESHSGDSDEDINISNLNDDVFTESIDVSKTELRPPTVMRRSLASDDSLPRSELKPPSPRGSHSSYSEEECSSSAGTNLEDGTVRYALKPSTKCTHSSHSEDTSIALSLSEWSNSTNTVKFQNLSSNSGTKSSSGLKSEDNSLTDIAQSISEWSSSNSNTLKAQQSTNLQFQKLSSTTSTGDSTLTEFLPTISDWSSSETSKTLVPQQFFAQAIPDRQSVTRLASDADLQHDLSLNSPQLIPSEDLADLSNLSGRLDSKQYTKSTERPVVIPPKLSDTERSTESSSAEQKTVHIQKYDKDKQKYSQKHPVSSKSTERPVKVPLKLSKCSPYYSSSLSSESTPLAVTSSIPISKTATVPLTRTHRKPVSRSLFQAKSPPSENDSTSSVESPKTKSERERRGYRRRRQAQAQKRHKTEKELHSKEEYYYVEQNPPISEYNQYLRNQSMEQLASVFQYENILTDCDALRYAENLEEGYFPDGDSQSGSDIFRMEKEDDRYEVCEGFDVSSIPPPLLDDDFDGNKPSHV